MHPHLVREKKLVCKEFVEALAICHSDWWKKYTGGCNDIKKELNSCLRQERIERTTKNREESKVRKAVAAEKMEKWKEG